MSEPGSNLWPPAGLVKRSGEISELALLRPVRRGSDQDIIPGQHGGPIHA